MPHFQRAILTHGGAGSNPYHSDGPLAAAKQGLTLLQQGKTALTAVVQAVRTLEADPRFNAGLGSQLRADGHTIQMDASCMTSAGGFGAVACVEGIQHPIDIAEGVLLHSNCLLLVGNGARCFAQQQAIPLYLLPPEAHTNLLEAAPDCDTVGAIAFDGQGFAAALSSGGLHHAPLGRVGDVPLPGCGLFCGPLGAVACTGDGEDIARKFLAQTVYHWLEDLTPEAACAKALSLFADTVDIGLIILTETDFCAQSRDGMAWSHQSEER